MLTKSMKKDIVKHILEVVFDLAPDSELHKALSQNNLFTPESMLSFPDDDYNTLDYGQQESVYPQERDNWPCQVFQGICHPLQCK